MAFFQNPFEFTFNGSLFGIGPQYTISYNIGANRNKSNYITAYNVEPYNLSSNSELTFNIAIDPDMLHFGSFTVILNGSDINAVTAAEVAYSLNSNSNFSQYFTAKTIKLLPNDQKSTVLIIAKDRLFFRCYISNTSACFPLAINKYAPVKEMPELFKQYAVQNIWNYYNYGSQRILYLDPCNPDDAKVITNAGFDPDYPTPDWKLLASASPLYTFTKTVYITGSIIDYQLVYHAGAVAGQMCKKIVYQYDDVFNVIGLCEIPYILTDSDLIDPDPITYGTLWGWGDNSNGQLGDDTTIGKSSPVQTITEGCNWKSVASGDYNAIAIKEDGTLWDWGYGGEGSIGDNETFDRSSPTQTITNGYNWVQVSSFGGTGKNFGIKSDGTLWGWGYNEYGVLGDNTTIWKSSPVQTITGGTNWKQVASGAYHTAAIKTDGTLWNWGSNYFGEIGDNTTSDRSSPVQTITFGTDWKLVSCGYAHTAAIKNDGTLWTWGGNFSGQLGDNTTNWTSSPIQTICGGNTWKSVSCGGAHTAAIKNDGTLWVWGENYYAELGDNSVDDKSSPVQTVTGGTNWKQVSAGYGNTAAIKNDGTLWVWGYNGNGELGDNTTINKSSPIQTIMGGKNWIQVACGEVNIFAIKKAGYRCDCNT